MEPYVMFTHDVFELIFAEEKWDFCRAMMWKETGNSSSDDDGQLVPQRESHSVIPSMNDQEKNKNIITHSFSAPPPSKTLLRRFSPLISAFWDTKLVAGDELS